MQISPKKIAKKLMMKQDRFSQLLGMKISKVDVGFCNVKLMVTDDMVNGFR